MKKTREKKPREFYVLLRQGERFVASINWAEHGKKWVYTDHEPYPGDVIIKVREVRMRKKRKSGRNAEQAQNSSEDK